MKTYFVTTKSVFQGDSWRAVYMTASRSEAKNVARRLKRGGGKNLRDARYVRVVARTIGYPAARKLMEDVAALEQSSPALHRELREILA